MNYSLVVNILLDTSNENNNTSDHYYFCLVQTPLLQNTPLYTIMSSHKRLLNIKTKVGLYVETNTIFDRHENKKILDIVITI